MPIRVTSRHVNRRPAASSSCRLLPLHQLHHIEQVPVVLAVARKLHDVRVRQPLERFDLDLEPLAEGLVVGQVAGEHLHRGPLARLFVQADIDRPHAAAAEDFFELVRSELFEGHETIEKRRMAA